MDKLGDWPKVLQNFGTIMQRIKVHATGPFSDTVSSAPIRLLRLLARNEWSQGYSKVEGNFLVAAMYVAFMKEFASKDSFPDIPDNFDTIVK
jgi:hypothetical protein